MKKIAVLLTSLTLLISSWAQAAVEGTDYTVLKQSIPQQHNDKVEVLEFFSYSCVHCYALDPIILKQSKTFAKDTYLRSEHVVWAPSYFNLARIAAAVNATGTRYQANPIIFNAMFRQQIDLSNPSTFKSWAAKQTGFDGKKVLEAYNSANSTAQAKYMQALSKKYNINGTPTVIVGGKYKLEFPQGDFQQGMKTLNDLIAKVRKERGFKPPEARKTPKSVGAALARQANR